MKILSFIKSLKWNYPFYLISKVLTNNFKNYFSKKR